MTKIYKVKEVVDKLSAHCSLLFPFVWVQGEVSNVSKTSTGNVYFSLKDEDSMLDCVWFFSNQKHNMKYDIVTGEVLEQDFVCFSSILKNGDYLYCAGVIQIYKGRGRVQLLVELAEYIGQGKYADTFQLQKAKLAEQGYFNSAYKKTIPSNPKTIALITAKNSAAIQDFLYIAETHGPEKMIYLYNVSVQGKNAVENIIQAIVDANIAMVVDIIVIIRGGGAGEDLSVFNNELLVQAVFSSSLPIITGIGHEIDTSLTDMVADAYGITPTHVAQMLWSPKEEIQRIVQDNASLLVKYIVNSIEKKLFWVDYAQRQLEQSIDIFCEKQEEKAIIPSSIYLYNAWYMHYKSQKAWLEKVQCSYRKAVFLGIFTREYQHILYGMQVVYAHVVSMHTSTLLQCEFYKKMLEKNSIVSIIMKAHDILAQFLQRMYTAIDSYFRELLIITERSTIVLDSRSPEAVLKMGYVRVEDAKGTWVRSLSIETKEPLTLHFYNGELSVTKK